MLHNGLGSAEGPPREALSPQVLSRVFDLEGEVVDTPAGPVVAARRRRALPR